MSPSPLESISKPELEWDEQFPNDPKQIIHDSPLKATKRKFQDLSSFQPTKRARYSPQPIYSWLQGVSRPHSAPPLLSLSTVAFNRYEEMSQPGTSVQSSTTKKSSTATKKSKSSTTTKKSGPDRRGYRDILANHGIYVLNGSTDPPDGVKALVETHITKTRDSSLTEQEIQAVLRQVDESLNSSEAKVCDILHTPMFTLHRPGLVSSGDATWSKEPLPTRPYYPDSLSAPKPDRQFGYPTATKTNFTEQEESIINNPFAKMYTQPTSEARLPFLTIEIKSEASGKNLWYAENQAAGSGTHMVASLRWLLHQAQAQDRTSQATQPHQQPLNPELAVAFSICLVARSAVLYIHYYREGRYYMYPVTRYWLDVVKDIQNCSREIQNVLDYGLGPRRVAVNQALQKLWPVPEEWSRKRKASPEANSAGRSRTSKS